MATTIRLAALRADVEAHEAAVVDDDPALFLVDLHHGMLDAIAGHASLLDVASWLIEPGTQTRARRWLAATGPGPKIGFDLLVAALRKAL